MSEQNCGFWARGGGRGLFFLPVFDQEVPCDAGSLVLSYSRARGLRLVSAGSKGTRVIPDSKGTRRQEQRFSLSWDRVAR